MTNKIKAAREIYVNERTGAWLVRRIESAKEKRAVAEAFGVSFPARANGSYIDYSLKDGRSEAYRSNDVGTQDSGMPDYTQEAHEHLSELFCSQYPATAQTIGISNFVEHQTQIASSSVVVLGVSPRTDAELGALASTCEIGQETELELEKGIER